MNRQVWAVDTVDGQPDKTPNEEIHTKLRSRVIQRKKKLCSVGIKRCRFISFIRIGTGMQYSKIH